MQKEVKKGVKSEHAPSGALAVAGNIVEQQAWLCKRVKLFANLGNEEITPLLLGAKIQRAREGEMLLRQEERPRYLVVLLSGQARIFRVTRDGREAVTRILQSGDTMFENVIFSPGPSPVAGEVLKEAELLCVPAELAHRYAGRSLAFANNLIKVLAERTNRMMYQIEQLTLHTAVDRLTSYLLSAMFARQGVINNFEIVCEKAMLAKHLGMTPETLSRSLKELAPYGVEVKGRKVQIKDPCALCDTQGSMLSRECRSSYKTKCKLNAR